MSGVFHGLKKKLSRRSSNPLSGRNMSTDEQTAASKGSSQRSGFLAPQTNNPFSTGTPATRRPSRSGMNAFTTPSNEPPPAYTPTPASYNPTYTQPAMATPAATADADDDTYAFLKTFDTIFLIDDSGSMAGGRWVETAKALEKIAPICTKRDKDGIDIYFLNHPDSPMYKNVRTDSTVREIFRTVKPGGATPTGQRLNKILKPYLARLEADKMSNRETTKPINIIVITDGAPSDDVEAPIISAAKKLDRLDAVPWQVGIQFFQVGKEPGARKHLKQLDDELKELAGGDLRDIVDTVPFTSESGTELTGEGVLKTVLGAVNRRLDRNSKELHRI
ncbi:hypothetical protein K458DRAFT_389678 [Lentithecium fluviatile CBS 122367]|uniref:VWFA domain-containing protein n=1 Tax=Lentithecium fluviatile CBS 122367 TaxID=1168545 RepID=A0A6G1IZS6_9PLEO|nr:hypothetical protein K458DRAFT_389678 [Lentithecium fluviatile CBS 122367]